MEEKKYTRSRMKDLLVVEKKYTRSRKKDLLMVLHMSAITDHVSKENHTIDWESVKFRRKTLIGLPEG